MRKWIALGLLMILLPGCSVLMPAKKEFFQKEVPNFPQPTRTFDERQRQAAAVTEAKAKETLSAALTEGSTDAVTRPAAETVLVADAVASSLGPPSSPWSSEKPVQVLVDSLNHEMARYRLALDKLETKLKPLEGKDVEGTGKIQMNYFVFLGGIVVIGFVAFTAIKVILQVVAAGNPAVGVGLAAVQLGGKAVGKLATEVLKGGETFKSWIKEKGSGATHTTEEILELFRSAQKESQSPENQDLVQRLTKKL